MADTIWLYFAGIHSGQRAYYNTVTQALETYPTQIPASQDSESNPTNNEELSDGEMQSDGENPNSTLEESDTE